MLTVNGFTEEELDLMLANLDQYTEAELAEIDHMVNTLAEKQANERARDDLLAFCKKIMPEYLVGAHHKILADILMAIERGEESRICVNMPPRHGKSLLVSTLFPAWFIGRNPEKKLMMVSHTSDLAVDFGRKVRNLVGQSIYQDIFPFVSLAADSKSAGRWNTNKGGEYYATGVGSSLAGRGADLLMIDDPHSEQDILNGNYEVFGKAYDWYTFGARTRLMPGGCVAVVQTRWYQDDLTGRLVKDNALKPNGDQFNVVEFPAILEVQKEDGTMMQKPLWPEFFDLKALLLTKESMPLFQWNAQYQQNPTGEEGAIVKREWWNLYGGTEPPKCEYTIMSLDTASETKTRADYTALTYWGVFFNEEEDAYNIILLNSFKQRFEFPELKQFVLEEYERCEPDSLIVEKKSSGIALYQELRRMGIPVQEYTPHRGTGDKTARLNSVADIVQSGLVWVPQTRWAEELVEEVASFPFAQHDDLVDSTVMALMRFRQGGFLRLPTDHDEPEPYWRRRAGGYY